MMTELQQACFNYISWNPGFNIFELSEAMALPRDSVRSLTKQLERVGKVHTVDGKAKYVQFYATSKTMAVMMAQRWDADLRLAC